MLVYLDTNAINKLINLIIKKGSKLIYKCNFLWTLTYKLFSPKKLICVLGEQYVTIQYVGYHFKTNKNEKRKTQAHNSHSCIEDTLYSVKFWFATYNW